MFSALSHFIFGNANFFGPHGQSDRGVGGGGGGSSASSPTWKDKKLCFDLRSSDLELDRGEQLIGCFYPIEDVKGNQDELGLLKATNLRLIWICCKKKRVNLSIGWRTVTLVYEQNLKDTLCGSSTSLFVLSKYDSTKYEFVFSKKSGQNDIWMGVGSGGNPDNWNVIAQLKQFSQDKNSLISHLSPMYLDDPFEVVFKVWQAYKQTHLFRHCRSNLLQLLSSTAGTATDLAGGEAQQRINFKVIDINKLPSEEIIEIFSNVAQLETRTIKHLGTVLLTNVRIIWLDDSLPLRNLSIPYIRIESIKLKQGDKIIVNAHDYLASSTHVDFQIQKSSLGPTRAAKLIAEQVQNLYSLYKSKPRYGPESCEDSINFMSHLRPIEHYFDSIDKSFMKTLENFGPQAQVGAGDGGRNNSIGTRDILVDDDNLDLTNNNSNNVNNVKYGDTLDRAYNGGDSDLDIERLEAHFGGHKSKLKSYLNEQPLDLDNDVIYSTDLGLAIERPANGCSIRSLWKIEVI